jgi:hypothetical protein
MDTVDDLVSGCDGNKWKTMLTFSAGNQALLHRTRLLACSLLAVCLFFCAEAGAQVSGPRTVGDGTAFVFSPGRSEGYGVYSGDIGGQVGESTGIGSSTLGTTSATSESTKPVATSFTPSVSQFSLNRPALPSPFQGSIGSPALGSFTVTPTNGLYSSSGLTSDYAETRSQFSPLYASQFGSQIGQQPAGVFQELDAVPSFIKQHTRAVLPFNSTGNDEVFKKIMPQF